MFDWEEALSDMVIATGLPYEVVVKFTRTQFEAVQRAVKRHWELMASVNGIHAIFGGGKSSKKDTTEEFEKRVKMLKKVTGKKTLDLWKDVLP